METKERYRKAIAEYQGVEPEQVSLFWKGRVGLFALLDAWSIGPGDEVILPAFTCVVVSNAILYRGAQPVYADVDRRTFNLLPQAVEEKISDRTKLIIAQNTFGLSSDLDQLLKIGRKHEIPLLEDATHGFGSRYAGHLSGNILPTSFFSTQWNKPFSTGIGGFTIAHEPPLANQLRQAERRYAEAPWTTRKSLQLQAWAREHLMHPTVYWTAVSAYRWLSARGWVTGSSSGEELVSTKMPADYLRTHSGEQAALGLKNLAIFPEVLERRKVVAGHYRQFLESLGLGNLYLPAEAEHGFLKFPLLVKDRRTFMEQAQRARIPLGDWMLSPIHPIMSEWERWGYEGGSCPNGEYLSRHIVNLLTEQSDQEVERTRAFLQSHQAELLPFV